MAFWDGGAANELFSDDDNWDIVAPGPGDTANYDGTSAKDCTVDVAEIARLLMVAAYTGIITQSIALFLLTGNLSLAGGALSKYVTAGNDLDIEGDLITTGAGVGLVHNAGGIVRVGGILSLDKGDVDSQLELFDFVGGSLVVHDFFMSLGSTELPTIFIIRSNNQLRVVTTSTVMNADFESGASIIDDGVSLRQFTSRGEVTIADYVGTILSTIPGALTMAFNALKAPGADYGQASFQVTSSLIAIQGDVVNVCIGTIARTFVAAAATLDMTLGSFSCEHLIVGSPVNDEINGDILVPAGRRLSGLQSFTIHATDGVLPTKVEFADGALTPTMGDLTVEALATLEMNSNAFTIPIAGPITIDPTAIVNWGDVTVILAGGANQIVDWGGHAPKKIINMKSGGLTTFPTGFTSSVGYFSRPTGPTNTKFQVGEVFVIEHFDLANTNESAKETIDSSDGATPVAITNASVGPIGRNTDVGRMTLAVGDQDMDSSSCTDLGGNTNFNFAEFPPETGPSESVVPTLSKTHVQESLSS